MTLGAASSTHLLATQAAMEVLERGGNAADAAVAGGLVMQVVEPHLNGPGGEVPILFFDGTTGDVDVIAGQGPAPAAATRERFGAWGLDLIPGTGPVSACVPGAFSAWMRLLRDNGSMRLRDVIEPAIGIAGSGFPVLPRIRAAIAAMENHFREHWPTSAETWLTEGALRRGRMTSPGIAATYARILEEAEGGGRAREGEIDAAERCFYEGFVAESIAADAANPAMDASGVAHPGLLTADDMSGWRAPRESAVSATYRGWTVFKVQPWSQGPVFLQQLHLLDAYDLAGLADEERAHVLIEVAKLALADREGHYGDPDFAEVPLDELLSPAYAAERRSSIGEEAALEVAPGLAGWIPEGGSQAEGAAGTAEPTRARLPGDTCHIDVMDRWGNAVAATPSGGWLQSSPVMPGLGFPLGTRAQMFWLEPGHPNSLEPGKRPRTTLSPTFAIGPREQRLAFGTPGGDSQDQWTLQFFVEHADLGRTLEAAITAPKLHSEHHPSSFWPRTAHPGRVAIESRFGRATLAGLSRRGHEVSDEGEWALGRVCALEWTDEGIEAAADPRGESSGAATL